MKREGFHKPHTARILSPREIEILEAVNSGLLSRDIAIKYSLSRQTVKNHICHIYSKLGATNRIDAINKGQSQGYLKPFDNFEVTNRFLDIVQEYINEKRREISMASGLTQ